MPAHVKRLLLTGVLLQVWACAQARTYRVPTGGMEPTLMEGDRVILEAPREYLRGDVVVVRFIPEPSVTVIKRLIGLPGDHVRLSDRVLILNSRPVNEKYVVHRGPPNLGDEFYFFRNFPTGAEKQPGPIPISGPGKEMLQKYVRSGELVVPSGQYFVMGDNRDYSLDSRVQGLITASMIFGLVREIVSSDDPDTKRPRPGRTMISIERGTLQ